MIVARHSSAAARHACACEPNKRRHAPAASLAPEGEKSRGVAVGAKSAAEHRLHPERRQTRACKLVEIALPAAARILAEGRRRARIMREERRAHLIADLEGGRSDRRPEPGVKRARIDPQGTHGRLEHTARKPAPAAMRGSDPRSVSRGKEHGQAVGDLNGADSPGHVRDCGVGAAASSPSIKIRNLRPMHLLKPGGLGGKFKKLYHARSIFEDRLRVIAHMSAEIERIKRRRAHATGAQRKCRSHPGRCGPVGREIGGGHELFGRKRCQKRCEVGGYRRLPGEFFLRERMR